MNGSGPSLQCNLLKHVSSDNFFLIRGFFYNIISFLLILLTNAITKSLDKGFYVLFGSVSALIMNS